jgi:hypothetical protein
MTTQAMTIIFLAGGARGVYPRQVAFARRRR